MPTLVGRIRHFNLQCSSRYTVVNSFNYHLHFSWDQSWVFIGGTDVEAEIPILWPPDVKSWLIWKDPDAEKDWRQVEKGPTGWDGWMASPTQWTWLWVNSRRTREAWRAAVHGAAKSQHDWATELNCHLICSAPFHVILSHKCIFSGDVFVQFFCPF